MVDRPLAQKWRLAVSNAVVKEISEEVMLAGRKRRALLAGYPVVGPLYIVTDFYFTRSANDESKWPTNRQYGDGDTLTRCVWDALTDAKCVTDDSLVVLWTGMKAFGSHEGVRIGIWAYDE
jgi:Holliday junction resolvase RusA-like endonuclease